MKNWLLKYTPAILIELCICSWKGHVWGEPRQFDSGKPFQLCERCGAEFQPRRTGFGQVVRSRTGVALILLVLILLAHSTLTPAVPGPLSTFAQGQIGLPTLRLGSLFVRPISAIVTNKAPVCLALVAVEIRDQVFGAPDSGIFLLGNQRAYPPTSITPVAQDALFGQRKIRAFGFSPIELCKKGNLTIEDLALLVIRPEGIGVVSFAASETAQANK